MMNDPKGGVTKVTCPTYKTMGQILAFHRTYFLFEYTTSNSRSVKFWLQCRGLVTKFSEIRAAVKVKKVKSLKFNQNTRK